MRVGLNLHFLTPGAGGAGRYAREVVGRMLELDRSLEITSYVSKDAEPGFLAGLPWGGDVDWVRLPVGIGGPPGHAALEMGAQMGLLAASAVRRRLHVVHGMANVAPIGGGRFARVVTLLDITWIHQPEVMDWRARAGTYAMALMSARAAHRVLAISDTARRDFVTHLGLDPARVLTVPLGVDAGVPSRTLDSEALRDHFDIGPGPIVLCVAQLRAHKNIPVLVEGLAALGREDVRLVVAGAGGSEEERARVWESAERLGVAGQVRLVGRVSDEELEGLYGAAACFALASRHEGFGLPLLEAMARRVPVACSDRSALPEVAGDAAELFDPDDAGSVAAALRRILDDDARAAALIERGLERVRGFSWDRTARLTLDTYAQAIAARRA